MPVLLMAQGDSEARDMLRRAIEARYGHRPPVIDSLQINFKGRTRVKIGPLPTWVPLEITAWFQLPDAMRWDFIAKPAGVAVQRGVEAFDGQNFRRMRGNGTPELIEEREAVESIQHRLWAIAALLLTPLGDHFVKLSTVSTSSFQADHTRLSSKVILNLREDNTLEKVSMEAMNTDTNLQQRFSIQASTELESFNDLLLPKKLQSYWDDMPYFEVIPVNAELNPDIESKVFHLGSAEASAN